MPARLFQRCARHWFGGGWLLLLCLTTPTARAQKGWLPGFNTPGLNGEVLAVTVRNRHSLIAIGNFTDAGGQLAADGAAHWNGRTWEPLGLGPDLGPTGRVDKALVLPNGDVVLGIAVYNATTRTGFVTRWNGHHWQHLGPDFPNFIDALALTPNGELLLSCRTSLPGSPAPASGVLHWDGQHWQPFGPLLTTPTQDGKVIEELLMLPNGELFANGYVVDSTGQHISSSARWNGNAWQTLIAQTVPYCLEKLVRAATGQLLRWRCALATTAYWDGSAWQLLTTGITGKVDDIELAPLTQELYLKGRFHLPNDTTTQRLARWNGTRWLPTAPHTDALATVPNGLPLARLPSGEVLVETDQGLMWWNGKTRQELLGVPQAGTNGGFRNSVQVLTVDAKGTVFLAGQLAGAPYEEQYRVARWDGRRLRLIGSGFARPIKALVSTANGHIVTGSRFDISEGVARRGGRWQPLTEGLSGLINALAAAPHGQLLAGQPSGVARWDGRHWQPLGPAEPAPGALTNSRALLVLPNGNILSSGRVFGTARTASGSVARWDGRTWQVLGEELAFEVGCLALAPNGDVVAGGSIRAWGNSSSGYVARWDGRRWQAMGSRLNGAVNALAVAANGDIIIGGTFEDAGAVDGQGGNPAADYVARWHDGAWQPLGTGLDDEVQALVVAPNGDIIVGGTFTATNDGLAMWHFGIYRDR